MKTSFALQVVVSAALLLAVRSGPALAAEEAPGKVKLLCSFEKEELEKNGFKLESPKEGDYFFFKPPPWSFPSLVRARHATHGELALFAYYCQVPKPKKNYPNYPRGYGYFGNSELMAQKRIVLTFYGATAKVMGGDWSGYDNLWIDVRSPEGDVWLRLLVEDQDDTTPYARYHVPKDQACTVVFPLAKFAAPGGRPARGPFQPTHIDLKKICNLLVYLDAAAAENGEVYLDNVRLAAKDAPAPGQPIEPTEFIERDWGWSELAKNHPKIEQPKVKREYGAVEKLGPITLGEGDSNWWSYLGADGPRFYRAIAAVDNKRILVMVHGKQGAAAYATFDGGKTWGGLDGTPGKPTELYKYAQVGWAAADSLTGNGYIVFHSVPLLPKGFATDHLELGAGPGYFDRFSGAGYCFGGGTMRCHSLRNIIFQGDKWQEPGPGAVLDDFQRHCVHWGDIVRHPGSGRLWAFVDVGGDVFGGCNVRALYSDDNGLIWNRSHQSRHLKYEETAERKGFGGFHAAPYGEHVALIGGQYYGLMWTFFDGTKWAPLEYVVKAGRVGGGWLVSWGKDGKKPNELFTWAGNSLLRLKDGKWEDLDKAPVIDDGSKGPRCFSILTVSGDYVFCFWVRDFEKDADGMAHSKILLRRYHIPTGQLGIEEELVTENEPIVSLATPHVSPPDYVPLVWCNGKMTGGKRYGKKLAEVGWGPGKGYNDWVRFLKIPNLAAK